MRINNVTKLFIISLVALFAVCQSLLVSCGYDEDFDVCALRVQLIYPEGSLDPYEGVRVELKDATGSIFVEETNADGTVIFQVPAGIYEASTATQTIVTIDGDTWRYNFNGVRSRIIVSHDNANEAQIELKMSRKRIVQ